MNEMPEKIGIVSQKASANAYASALKISVPTHIERLFFHVKENNTNAIKVKVLGSVDDSVWEEVIGEAVVAKDASSKLATITDPWPYLDFQIASNVAETHGKATVYAFGGS